MKRTKLSERILPAYSRGEERMNTITHAIGAPLGIWVLISCILRARSHCSACLAACIVYSLSFLTMFTISAVYHGLKAGMAKKVLQVVDHCTIYFLIAGSYTAVALCALRPVYPAIAWGLFFFEWALAALAATLTAIDLKKYNVFSMVCYIGMGWAVIPFWRQTLKVLTGPGFALLLSGGIAYTIGAVLYGIGSKKKWMHSVFHIFVILGALLQFFAVLFYAV